MLPNVFFVIFIQSQNKPTTGNSESVIVWTAKTAPHTSRSHNKCTMSPAACHVVPDVSRSRSSSTTSWTPNLAKWYATCSVRRSSKSQSFRSGQINEEQGERARARHQSLRTDVPMIPPPTTTTLARSGSCCFALDGEYTPAPSCDAMLEETRCLTDVRRCKSPTAFVALTRSESILPFLRLAFTCASSGIMILPLRRIV